MERLTNYKFSTDIGEYVSERTKIDKGLYDFKIFSDTEIIAEEKDVKIKNGKDLNKRIRKIINSYEKNLEDPLKELKEEEAELDKEFQAVGFRNQRRNLKNLPQIQKDKTNKLIDSKRKALLAGKRISKTGKVYWETRANRSDAKGKNI